MMLVDESGYRQRMGATSPRLAQRREAWQALADAAGVGLVNVDLQSAAADAAALAEARAALEAVLAVRATP
jgi:hypothetical protein